MITPENQQLLEELAKEWRETPEQLINRLIQKEHFNRHVVYIPMKGCVRPKQCLSMDCFMKATVPSE